MGTIREITKKNGTISYHAEVRLRGFPKQRSTHRTRTKAKEWIQSLEAEIKDGRYKKRSIVQKHTVLFNVTCRAFTESNLSSSYFLCFSIFLGLHIDSYLLLSNFFP